MLPDAWREPRQNEHARRFANSNTGAGSRPEAPKAPNAPEAPKAPEAPEGPEAPKAPVSRPCNQPIFFFWAKISASISLIAASRLASHSSRLIRSRMYASHTRSRARIHSGEEVCAERIVANL